MPRSSASSDLRIEITPESLRTVLGKSSSFDANQKKHLRKRIREAADESKKAVQAEALKAGATKGKSRQSRGLRAGIAKGTRVQILAGNRAGVSIVTRAKLGAAWTAKRGWRHPTFGNREAWQPQTGNPGYFARTIWGKRNVTKRAIEQAMADTLRDME